MFASLSPNARGMLAMTTASVIFIFSDVLAKIATQTWPVSQVMAVRGLFAIALTLGLVIKLGNGRDLALMGKPRLLLRTLAEAITSLTFISALSMMPLADLTSILMMSPLVITAIATLFLGEIVGWRRWTAIIVGFAGMLLVVQPSGAPAGMPHYYFACGLGLVAVFGVATRDILTRRLGGDVPSTVVTLSASIGVCGIGFLLSFNQPWRSFEWTPFLACFGAACIVTTGNFLMVLACRGVDLSVVAPYRYSAVIWAIILGATVFGEYPNWISVLGMGLIVASGIYTMHRERVRQREAARTPPAA